MGSIPTVASNSLFALALTLVSGVGPAPAQERDPSLSAEITVFEAQATLDVSELGFRDRQRLKPDQLLVLEGGQPRRVTNLEPLGSGSWRILIYVDAPLSRARTVRLATLRLGDIARRLTDLGTVEIVVADPEPRTVLGPTREAVTLADQLAKLAASDIGTDELHRLRGAFGEAEAGLAPTDPRRREGLRLEADLVRARVDRLLLRLAEGCEGEPCALFLVSDGFYEDPETFYLGEKRLAAPGESKRTEEASRELAQAAAAYEWIVFPLPLREERLETPVVASPQSDFDVFLDHTGAIRRAPKRSDREPVIDLESIEVSIAPILQPLQRLAVESAGEVVRIADDVEQPIEGMPDRRRVYYLTDRPFDGDVRAFRARLVETAAPLRAPAWVRSSTPPAVAGSRMRELLGGRKVEGGVPVRARIEPGAGGQAELVVEADWGKAAELLPKSTIRVSVGYTRRGEEPWVAHQRVVAGEVGADGSWRHRIALALPDGVERVAVVAEALVPRAWGATLVEPAR